MNSLFVILTVLILIASILLTIAVLLQSSKGEGLASNFVAANQTFGVRQTAEMLEKVTWGLVAFILVVSIISAFTLRTPGSSNDYTEQIENAVSAEQPEFPSAPVQMEDPSSEPLPAEDPSAN